MFEYIMDKLMENYKRLKLYLNGWQQKSAKAVLLIFLLPMVALAGAFDPMSDEEFEVMEQDLRLRAYDHLSGLLKSTERLSLSITLGKFVYPLEKGSRIDSQEVNRELSAFLSALPQASYRLVEKSTSSGKIYIELDINHAALDAIYAYPNVESFYEAGLYAETPKYIEVDENGNLVDEPVPEKEEYTPEQRSKDIEGIRDKIYWSKTGLVKVFMNIVLPVNAGLTKESATVAVQDILDKAHEMVTRTGKIPAFNPDVTSIKQNNLQNDAKYGINPVYVAMYINEPALDYIAQQEWIKEITDISE